MLCPLPVNLPHLDAGTRAFPFRRSHVRVLHASYVRIPVRVPRPEDGEGAVRVEGPQGLYGRKKTVVTRDVTHTAFGVGFSFATKSTGRGSHALSRPAYTRYFRPARPIRCPVSIPSCLCPPSPLPSPTAPSLPSLLVRLPGRPGVVSTRSHSDIALVSSCVTLARVDSPLRAPVGRPGDSRVLGPLAPRAWLLGV